ncbi:MAG: class I SAM-dependent methyltransferase [Candidatus Latescibacteria bacterium]|jgi:SAM-dependent methyltransferase|nr:class I SAM-dependent methyltransferase [Candidatus Latescibacterota bacterium]
MANAIRTERAEQIARETAERWEEERGVSVTNKLWTYCAGKYGGPILDPACGNGRWSIGLAELCPDCEVVGFDINPTFIERANQRVGQLKAEGRRLNASFHVQDLVDFDLGQEFGLAILPSYTWSTIITQPDQIAFLECLRRHLKPGGAFALYVFMPEHRQAELELQQAGTYAWPEDTVYSTQVKVYDALTQIERPEGTTGEVVRHTYLSEFELLFRLTGFKIAEMYGRDDDMRPFTGRYDDDYGIVAEAI